MGSRRGSGNRLRNLKIRTLFALDPKDRKPQKPVKPKIALLTDRRRLGKHTEPWGLAAGRTAK